MDGITRALDVRDPTIGFGAGLLFGSHIKGVRQKVRFVCQITAGPRVIIRGGKRRLGQQNCSEAARRNRRKSARARLGQTPYPSLNNITKNSHADGVLICFLTAW